MLPAARPRRSAVALLLLALVMPTPAAEAVPPTSPSSEVRPGLGLSSVVGHCTLSFAFAGSDGVTYFATAGHCAPVGSGGQSVWKPGKGEPVFDAAHHRIGRFAFARLINDSDFALIRLAKGVRFSPAMCAFGGPVGLAPSKTAGPIQARQYGQGEVIGQASPGRPALLAPLDGNEYAHAFGLAVPGDSGSPVEDVTGAAIGTVNAIDVGGEQGIIGVNRFQTHLLRAEHALGNHLRLLTAPLRSVVDSPDCPS
jgi:hypothetical protein